MHVVPPASTTETERAPEGALLLSAKRKDEVSAALEGGAERRSWHNAWRRPLLCDHCDEQRDLQLEALAKNHAKRRDDAEADRAKAGGDTRVVLGDVDEDERQQNCQEDDDHRTPDGVGNRALNLDPEFDHGEQGYTTIRRKVVDCGWFVR
jgi:hypothetical protein